MFGILMSAAWSAVGWIFRSVVIKFGVMFAAYFLITGLVSALQTAGILPTAATLTNALGGFTSGVWYLLDWFQFSAGIGVVMSALATKFIIRRLPWIG